MAKFPSTGQRPFNAKASGSGGGRAIQKIRKIAAPTPPKPASMGGMGNKLRKGDAQS